MDIRRFATVMPTFELREIGALAVDEYRLSTAEWLLPRELRPTDLAIATSCSFPLGLSICSVQLTGGECVLRLVNVLGSPQKGGRAMVVLELVERAPERTPLDFRRVILESPFRELDGEDPEQSRAANALYRQACIRDSLKRGEAPFASHQMYTEALDDTVPEERLMGMTAGLAWHEAAVAVVVYVDRGVSAGMQKGIEYAQVLGLPIERRELGFERRVRAGMEEGTSGYIRELMRSGEEKLDGDAG